MQIKAFRLHNIGRFASLDASFLTANRAIAKVVVFIGNNGAGKTSILKSLSTSLSWFVARVRTEKGNGSAIKDDTISNHENFAKVEIEVHDDTVATDSNIFTWSVSRPRTGTVSPENSNLAEVTQLASHYRNALTHAGSLNIPLVAYYPVERAVTDAPLKSRNDLTFPQLAGYEGLSDNTTSFSSFFEWFRNREDHENELKALSSHGESLLSQFHKYKNKLLEAKDLTSSKIEELTKVIDEQIVILQENMHELPRLQSITSTLPIDSQLNAVRAAIQNFMPGFINLRVQRMPRLQMLVEKDEQTLDILQLSQGEKSLMALVGDIARRLAMLNPSLEDPLKGKGVVLIDEVDMHLHPRWQRSIVQQLVNTFPNCQFILTTHSPLVISDSKDILVYSLDHGVLKRVAPQYGQDANSVLLGVMDTPVRNEYLETQLGNLFDLIQAFQLDEANQMIAILEQELPDPASNVELAKAKLMLRKQGLRLEKNR
ncbi:AAA family ATPase [Pseudomonas asiatica]|uniref:AAA family ATPase n=1 Tax=Pseudomonas asiatica TaxID=2219225 RepID=UPI0015FE0985|nr:AAA family ATPase [Pseudomonas asiatica]MBA6110247.1 AAA family ATPase [Pseudomonas asiatica]